MTVETFFLLVFLVGIMTLPAFVLAIGLSVLFIQHYTKHSAS